MSSTYYNGVVRATKSILVDFVLSPDIVESISLLLGLPRGEVRECLRLSLLPDSGTELNSILVEICHGLVSSAMREHEVSESSLQSIPEIAFGNALEEVGFQHEFTPFRGEVEDYIQYSLPYSAAAQTLVRELEWEMNAVHNTSMARREQGLQID